VKRGLSAPLTAAVAVAFADSSIVVLALPELYARFNTTIEGVSWVVTAYNLAVAVTALALVLLVHRLDTRSVLAAGLGLFLAGAFFVYRGTPHVRERVQNWIHPWSDHKVFCPISGQLEFRQDCQSYQEVQSLYSIAHGGFGGTGLGHGIVTGPTGKQVVPDLNTDFIYSALAQELGLVGAAAILLLYMAFVVRGFQVALSATDGFSKLLAAGLSFSFAFQTFVIVGGITRVIPLTGITLPFVSYGGSSVVANFLLVAGLLLISNRANRELAAR